MPENQKHGFTWEDSIKRDVFDIVEKIPYTEEFDIPGHLNKKYPGENISIKTTHGNCVDMGDALRMYKNEKDVTLIVVRYDQIENTKKIHHIVESKMPPRDILFGNVTLEEIEQLNSAIRSVPPGKPTPDVLSGIHALKETLNKKSGVLAFRPKLDSQRQRRLQCSFSNFPEFLQKYPQYQIAKTEGSLLRGILIPLILESARRVRH